MKEKMLEMGKSPAGHDQKHTDTLYGGNKSSY